MELTVDTPQGTKLKLDSDRQFDRPQGDSVMRIQSQAQDGGSVFDATYVELDAKEAELIAELLHQTQHPSPELRDRIAQEVHAAFSSKLSGRDAAQIAEIVARSWWRGLQNEVGIGSEPEAEQFVERLSERFNRTASKRREPLGGSSSSRPGRSALTH